MYDYIIIQNEQIKLTLNQRIYMPKINIFLINTSPQQLQVQDRVLIQV
jgi:hypothetical protein